MILRRCFILSLVLLSYGSKLVYFPELVLARVPEPELFLDINPGSGSSPYVWPGETDELYFAADNGVNGVELWKTDGTIENTFLVKDINTGSNSSNPLSFVSYKNYVFFSANDGINGKELWRTDGTSDGTILVKNIRAGSASSGPNRLVVYKNYLYFSANDGINGLELWRTDGTAEGTSMFKNIRAGSASSNPTYLAADEQTLFFTADDGINGSELWKSDGTDAGTTIVTNIRAGGTSTPMHNLGIYKNIVYFTADDGIHGLDFWRSDGTAAGTYLVKELDPLLPVFVANFTSYKDQMYFMADGSNDVKGLYVSNGTANQTERLFDGAIYDLYVFNDYLFFNTRTYDSMINPLTDTVWKYDGRTNTVSKVIEYSNTTWSSGNFYGIDNTLFFIGFDSSHGAEWWKLEADVSEPNDVKLGLNSQTKKQAGQKTLKIKDRKIELHFDVKDDFGVDKIKISEKKDFNGASWKDFDDGKINFKLSEGDETKTIYFKFKDTTGNDSELYKQKFELDTTPPKLEILEVAGFDYEDEISKALDKRLFYTSSLISFKISAPDSDEIRLVVNNSTAKKIKLTSEELDFQFDFPLGTHTVQIVAEDRHGYMSSESFQLAIDPTERSFPSSLRN